VARFPVSFDNTEKRRGNMDALDIVVPAIAGIILFVILPIMFIYYEAQKGRRAIIVKQNHFQIIVKGDTLHKIICFVLNRPFIERSDRNLLPGMIEDVLSHLGKEIVDEAKKVTKDLDIRTGFVIGKNKAPGIFGIWTTFRLLLYPLYKLLSFEIDKARRPEIGEKISEQIIHQKEAISEIRVYPVRLIALTDVEFKGNVRANIMLVVSLFIFNPEILAFRLREKFYPRLEAMILEAFQKYAGKITWQDFIERGYKNDNFFKEYIVPILGQMVSELGVLVTQTTVEWYDLSEGEKEISDALKAGQKAKLQAEAVVAEAKGKAQALRIEGNAIAAQLRALVKAGKENPEAVIEDLRRRGITETKISTLVNTYNQSPSTLVAIQPENSKNNSKQ
jgi:hypothetical protein